MDQSPGQGEPFDDTCAHAETASSVQRLLTSTASADVWAEALAREINERRRAECMARIQSDAVQLAIDLLVREPDIAGFFRVFIKTLVEECESHACGVWLLQEPADGTPACQLWMAYVEDRFYTRESEEWNSLALPRDSMSEHLLAYRQGWTEIVEYDGQDARLPEPVRAFNRARAIDSVLVAPLVLPTRNLGWFALSRGRAPLCDGAWHRALLDALARQATLALHQSQLAEHSRTEARRQAVLEERNRLARDIHDTLAQGFAAILMQLQAAQRCAASLPPAVARSVETAVELARTHMIEARRSVGALRPQEHQVENVGAALERMVELVRRSTEVPIELTIVDLPPFSGGADREILGIAQEALNNAVRHARARRITIRAEGIRSVGFRLSVADNGRGIAKERRGLGFGMTSMQERADRIGASLTIVTAARSGTDVVLAWEPAPFAIPEMTAQTAAETV
ncbi:MAG TPA: sensor histidine kinase [Vicinamibacterales bacterium]|nr:sensor histidine kinase [Vicinamibacterales bacterium]